MGHETGSRCVRRRGPVGPFCGTVDFEEECCCQIAKEDDSARVRVLTFTELEVGECLLPRCKVSTDIWKTVAETAG